MTQLHEIVKQGDLAPITRKLYLKSIDEWITFAGPNPTGWNRYRAQEFYQMLLMRMKPQSANRVLAGVAYASRWFATKENRPDLDFCVVQVMKKDQVDPTVALDDASAIALLETTRGDDPIDVRDRAIITLGLETGMRAKSLVDVRGDEIKQAKAGYPTIDVKLKSSREKRRPIALSDTAMLSLNCWRHWMVGRHAGNGWLFQSLTKRMSKRARLEYTVGNDRPAITTTAVYQIVRSRGERVGLAIHPHVFRSTFVTWRLAMGFAPHQISCITYHSMALGAMGEYIDREVIAGDVRNSTPAWLAQLVRGLCS